MRGRETAWRVFAGELGDASLVLTGEEERAPTYVITPMGAKINRVFIVGVLTDLENVGSPEEPMWRAKMADPTGTFVVSAGQFQPEAAMALSKMPVPGFAAIIGKVRVYSPEEGVNYISVRPEVVKTVEKDLRDFWVLDCCKSLKRRLEAVEEARNMSLPSAEELKKLGYNEKLADGIIAAMQHYGDFSLERYQTMLLDSLRYLIPEEGGGEQDIPAPAPSPKKSKPEPKEEEEFGEAFADEPAPPAEEKKEESDEELTAEEEKVLAVINELDPNISGIDWDTLTKASKKTGLKKPEFESAVEGLLEKGIIYEPMLGKIRKI
jgi:RPA family protein